MNRLAINGGKATKTKPFPEWPRYDEREINNVMEVFKSHAWWRVTGTKVKEFEQKFAAFQGAEYCLGVTNGTHATELCLMALEIGKGDEVIVPAMTFISTGLSVLSCNAVPVLVDVDPDTYCMTPEAFEAAITEKTKAVIPVHMAGHACDMEKICAIAKKKGIYVIEDAAHGHGGECAGKRIGSFGDAAIFSFQNGKLMTSGEGGAIVTRRKDVYDKAYLIQDVGRPRNDKIYQHVLMGENFRMSEFQAAILLAQMERVDELNQLRENNAKKLDELLKEVKGITPQGRSAHATLQTHYMYMFYYDSSEFGGLNRLDFVNALVEEGIPANVCFPVLSDTEFFMENNFRGNIPFYDRSKEVNLSNARKVAENVIWLHHKTLEGDEIDLQEIVQAIEKIQKAYVKEEN